MERLQVGIIGAGDTSERIIIAAMNHPHIKIKSIYDRDLERLLEVSRSYWLDAYSSYKEVLEDDELDLIYLAAPPLLQYNLGIDIFKSDKHFLCEKLLGVSSTKVEKMLIDANCRDKLCAMNFPLIYEPAYEKMKQLVAEGFLGKVLRVEFQAYLPEWPRPWQKNPWVTSRDQGGFTREIVSHYVQLIHRLFGDIENIKSYISYPDDPELSEKSLIAKADIRDIEVLFNCIVNVGMKVSVNFNIIGTKGSISLKNWDELWVTKKETGFNKLKFKKNDPFVTLLDHIYKATTGADADIVSLNEGMRTHRVIDKLLENNIL